MAYSGIISAIANLEIRTADLLAAKAELERQQEEEKLEIEDEVLNLLLDYEAKERKHGLILSLKQQREVIRIAYCLGRGSTNALSEGLSLAFQSSNLPIKTKLAYFKNVS